MNNGDSRRNHTAFAALIKAEVIAATSAEKLIVMLTLMLCIAVSTGC